MRNVRIASLAMLLFVSGLLAACAQEAGVDVDQVPTEVTGVIVSIEPEDGQPETLTVREEDDETFVIEIADDIDYGFDLHHLHEHRTTADPVIITLEQRDDTLVATSIEDV